MQTASAGGGGGGGSIAVELLHGSRSYQALASVFRLVRISSDKVQSLLMRRRKPMLLTTGVTVAAALGLAWLWRERQRSWRKSKLRHHHHHQDNKGGNSSNMQLHIDEASEPHGHSRRMRVRKNLRKNLEYILRITVPGFKSREFRYIIAIAALIILKVLIENKNNILAGEGLMHIINSDGRSFAGFLVSFTSLSAVVALIAPTTKFLMGRLSLMWRRRLTQHFHKLYLSGMMYYRMSHIDRRIENPDQVITQDIVKYCDLAIEVLDYFIRPGFELIFYSISLMRTGAGFIPLACFVYMMINVNLIRYFMPNFGKLAAKMQSLEGEFRSLHNRLVTYAEPIAFFGGDKSEHKISTRAFNKLTQFAANEMQHLGFGIFYDFFRKYFPHSIVWLILAYPVFFGHMRHLPRGQVITEVKYLVHIVISILLAVSGLLHLYQLLNELSGYASGLCSMAQISSEIRKRQNISFDKEVEGIIDSGDVIAFEDISVYTPTGVLLAEHLSFEVVPGRNTLIIGPNGSGKSSLFRVLGGLWSLYKGRLTKPGGSTTSGLFQDIFYLPQKPYNVIGTLREQLQYPQQPSSSSSDSASERAMHHEEEDHRIKEILDIVNLAPLAKRHGGLDGKITNWDSLSAGEQQRLAMARLFYHKPKYAILDECTSAVTVEDERTLYEKCKELGITCITISHRPALMKYHQYVLCFDGAGAWTYRAIESREDDATASSSGQPLD